MDAIDSARLLLRGMSQVMLQNNLPTGALFLLGILLNSWVMFIGALMGVTVGTLTAIALQYDKKDIEDGLYGFNGALVGISLFFFLVPDSEVLLLVIAGAVLSSLIMNAMHRKKMSPYTFPFVVSAWALLFLNGQIGHIAMQAQPTAVSNSLDALSALSMGMGQVMFQGNVLTGIVFLAALLVSSRISAAYALLGALAGMLFALLLSFPLGLANIGIYGYNAVLCGIALGGRKKHELPLAIAACALSVLMVYIFGAVGVPALTAPFVFSAWIVAALAKK